MAEALQFPSGGSYGGFAEANAARELAAAQREAARRQQVQAAVIQAEEEEIAELESQEEEAQAARALSASQRSAARGKGEGGGGNDIALVTDTAGEIMDLLTAAIEIETIIVPLILLANYHVRFLSGNIGVLPEAGGPLSLFLDKCMEVAGAGAKTAGKAAGSATAKSAGSSAAGAGGKSVGSFGGGDFGGGAGTRTQAPRTESGPSQASSGGDPFEVKKLAIWQIFVLVVVDILLALVVMVNFLIMIAVPLIIAAAIGGTLVGFCLTYPDVCSSVGSSLEALVTYFTS
ncbi:hypothetical protein EPO33_05275 [Patescibacteria group bacterium]|nr:MAG: hypothetical protein EPO33_05275 [Patescibacteria group bacterium]